MKQVKNILILTIAFLLSCNLSFSQDFRQHYSANLNQVEKPYSNPVFIEGSSFGVFLQMLYKTGKFDEMIKFTSQETINKFGEKKLIEFYKNMDFGYKIKLKSKDDIDGYVLNYDADIMATKRIARIHVSVENDTCKLILNSILNKNPFVENNIR